MSPGCRRWGQAVAAGADERVGQLMVEIADRVLGSVVDGRHLVVLYTAANPASVAGPARSRLDVGIQAGRPTNAAPVGVAHLVTFEAVGIEGATSTINITYSQDFNIKQEQGVKLPYTKDVNYDGTQPRLWLWVQNLAPRVRWSAESRSTARRCAEAKSSGRAAYGKRRPTSPEQR